MTRKGFTLVELSIILVIIGLIVGGIIGGRSLIESANKQGVIRQVNAIKVALNSYELQYDAKPGDHVNAYDYFAGGNNSICGTNGSGSEANCNGNGNNFVTNGDGEFRQWQHLVLANMLKNDVSSQEKEVLLATSWRKITSQGRSPVGFQYHIDSNRGKTGHAITFVADNVSRDSMTVEEAKWFDKKLDDGSPITGSIFADSPMNNCSSDSGVWKLSNTGDACKLYFWLE